MSETAEDEGIEMTSAEQTATFTGTPLPGTPGNSTPVVNENAGATESNAEPKDEPKVKTGYIVLKVRHDWTESVNAGKTAEDIDGLKWPPLQILNSVGDDGQPKPIEAYSRAQAVKLILGALGIEAHDEAIGDFIAMPQRSFRIISRSVETKTEVEMVTGKL